MPLLSRPAQPELLLSRRAVDHLKHGAKLALPDLPLTSHSPTQATPPAIVIRIDDLN